MKLVEISVKRPVGVIMIVLAILALGGMSLKNLAVDLYPEVDLPIAVVATSYPGAGPEEIEKSISKPLEEAFSTIQGMDTVQSQSMSGSSLVVMMFASGTNLDNALLEVREKVDQVKGHLPDNANDPSVLRFDPQQIPVMYVGLTGADLDKLQLIAENTVKPYFERTQGVASAGIDGGLKREIQVELDQSRMLVHNVSTSQIIQSLGASNRTVSAGQIKKGIQDLQIRVDGEFVSIEDIGNTLITLSNGNTIKVSDVATVKDTFEEQKQVSKVNNKPSLVLSILKESGANTVKVADEMYKTMDEIGKKLPDGVKLELIFDTSTFIRDSIDSVTSNMISGGILATIILLLFLRNIRATIVIAISIPIAVISTFTLMYFTGQTINILSMGGLALGIGMMVDSSIVILENIFHYRQKGHSVLESAIKGGSELAGAIIASTTTTLVVFLPIVYVEGLASDLFTPLALAVSFSLIASLVVALTLVPMFSSKLLGTQVINIDEGKGIFLKMFNKLNKKYSQLLAWVLGHRKTTVFVTVAAIIASFALTPFIKMENIPASDQGMVEVKLETPVGSTVEETEEIANQIGKEIDKYKKILATNYLSIGVNNQTGTAGSGNLASFQILMVDPKERDMTTKEFIKNLKKDVKDIVGGEIVVAEMEQGLGTGKPVAINISGPEQDVLTELGEQVTWLIEEIDGITNVESSAADAIPQIKVDINDKIASQYGLSAPQVMEEVQLGFSGSIATLYRENGDEFNVRVLFPEEKRTNINDLQQMLIRTATGQLVPLSTIAEIKQVLGPVQINREDQQRQVNVSADLVGRDLGSATVEITKALGGMNFPEGYNYNVGGQSEDMNKSFQDLGLALIFSIFLVYIVMAVQFESIIYPFVIMFSIPPMLIGVLTGLFITGQPFSIPAFIGIIMLAGVVVNNAIVLVEYINILRRRGYDRIEAILEAGPSRLRPILMTTLTTVLGMIPLALGIGEGGEAQMPLAVVVIFGLSTSTLITLLFVPVMYTYLEDFNNWNKKLRKRIFSKFKFKIKRNKKIEDVTIEQ